MIFDRALTDEEVGCLSSGVSVSSVAYSYDLNGNLVSKTDANDANNNAAYTWDWNNRLISVSSVSSVAYSYDGDGTRISKTQGGVQTKYINDVALPLVQVLLETTDTNIVQAVYTYGNSLISMKRADVNSYYHYDGLGSTRQMTDDSGTVTKSYTYDSFGNVISSFGSVANSYGFTGEQQFNEADNLVFLRARYYDSKVGRFMSRDPIGYEDGANLYTYVLNNSINWVDPSGSIKIKPPRGLVSVGCMAAIVGACAVLCHNDYWDNPCDTWGDCMNKCASTVIDPRKSFGPDSNGVIRAVAIACGIAIIIGF